MLWKFQKRKNITARKLKIALKKSRQFSRNWNYLAGIIMSHADLADSYISVE